MRAPQSTTSRVAVALGVVALMAGAAWLRFASLDHGLPLLRGRPDELEVIEATKTFPAGDFNPRFFVYPNLFFYVVYGWIQAILAVRRAGGDADVHYKMLLESGVPVLIYYGRALTAAVGTASVAIAFAIGRRAAGTAVGLVTAALLAANFLHVRDSHALKPDVLLGICMLGTLWALSRWVETRDRRHAVLAGVAIGLTMAIKYNGIFLLVPAWIEDALASPRRGWRRVLPSTSLVTIGAVAAVVFLAACPYLLLDFGRATFTSWFLAFTVFSTRPQSAAPAGAGLLDVALNFVRTRAFAYHWTMSLWHGFGAFATIALPVAVVRAALRDRPPLFRMCAVFAVVYWLVVGTAPVHLVRYFTALVPILCLLLAALVVEFARQLGSPFRQAVVAAVLTAVLCAQPVASGLAHDRIAAETDTRVLAAEWMRKTLPPNALVAVLGATLFTYADPELPSGVRRAPPGLPVDAYGRDGVGYVVTHEHKIPFSHLDPAVMAKLSPHLKLLAEWSPFRDGPTGGFEDEDAFYIPFFDFAGVVRPGPLVRVYQYEP